MFERREEAGVGVYEKLVEQGESQGFPLDCIARVVVVGVGLRPAVGCR